jgi:hypothetical protein
MENVILSQRKSPADEGVATAKERKFMTPII